LTAVFCFTGIGHFVVPGPMSQMIPPFVPYRIEIIYLTGVIEIMAGLLLLPSATRRRAGGLILLMLVLFLPINIYAAIERIPFGGHEWGPAYLWIRVPLQVVLAVWCVRFALSSGTRIFHGRYTTAVDQPFVVFLIGMRINQIGAIHKWLPTALAMPRMLRVLEAHPEKGFWGGEIILYWRGIGVIQYWRSFDDLERFARDPADPHLDAWRRYNRTIGADGTVGFWHETYLIEPGCHEEIYGNMPLFGLAAATKNHVSALGRIETARGRLKDPTEASRAATNAP